MFKLRTIAKQNCSNKCTTGWMRLTRVNYQRSNIRDQAQLTRFSDCNASAHERISTHNWQQVSTLVVRRSSSVAHDNRSVTDAVASVMTFDCVGFTAATDCCGCGWAHSRDDDDWQHSCKWITLLADVSTSSDWDVGLMSPSGAPPNCLICDSRARHLAAEELRAETSETLSSTYTQILCDELYVIFPCPVKCWPIFKTLSQSVSVMNLQSIITKVPPHLKNVATLPWEIL